METGWVDVDEMLDNLDPLQFEEWKTHFAQRLTPSERSDLSNALFAYWLIRCVCHGLGVKPNDVGHDGPFTLLTFAPWQPLLKHFAEIKSKPQSEAEMKSRLRTAARLSSEGKD